MSDEIINLELLKTRKFSRLVISRSFSLLTPREKFFLTIESDFLVSELKKFRRESEEELEEEKKFVPTARLIDSGRKGLKG